MGIQIIHIQINRDPPAPEKVTMLIAPAKRFVSLAQTETEKCQTKLSKKIVKDPTFFAIFSHKDAPADKIENT